MMRFEEFCQHLEATGYRVRLSGVVFETRAEKILEACRTVGIARIERFDGDEFARLVGRTSWPQDRTSGSGFVSRRCILRP
jgi:Ni,Fe-hydrogenase III large subunit